MNLITQNTKLKKTSAHFGRRVFNFGIPAYKSVSGEITCPLAGECVEFCYARSGAYIWSNVKSVFEKRLEITKQSNFPELMKAEIIKKKVDFLRVHDSGDYYSKEYLFKWFDIARSLTSVKFYSYTNNINQIKKAYSKNEIPKNYDFIFSDSGKQAHLINKSKDRHTKIFKSENDLKNAQYVNASEFDLYATKWISDNKKVGLIFH